MADTPIEAALRSRSSSLSSDPNLTPLRDLHAKTYFASSNGGDATAAASQRALTGLRFHDAGLGTTGAQALAAALPPFAPGLRALVLSGNSIRPLGLSTLLATLVALPALTTLSLVHERLGDSGAAMLSAALPQMPALASLTLSRNAISAEGGAALAAALPHCAALERFVAHSNPFGSAGVALLGRGLARAPALVTIGLSATRMGDKGLRALLEALTRVCLPDGDVVCAADDTLALEAAPALQSLPDGDRECALEELAIAHNTFGDDGAAAMRGAVPLMPRLHTVLARCNEMSEDALVELYEELDRPGFTRIDLPKAPFHRVKDIFANNDAFVTARRSSSGHGRSSGGRSLAASRSLSRQSTLESAARLRPALSDVPLRSPSLLGSMRRPSLDVGASGAGDAAKAKSLFERLAHL